MSVQNFASDNHALLCGGILMALVVVRHEGPVVYQVTPVLDDEGNYTPTIRIQAPSGGYEVTVRPVED